MERDMTQSLTRRLPWAVTAAVTVGFVAAWPKPEPARPTPAPSVAIAPPTVPTGTAPTSSASASVVPSGEPPLQLLDTCMTQLRRQRAASRMRDPAVPASKAATKPDVARCLELPEVAQAIEDAGRDLRPATAANKTFVQRFNSQVVGVKGEEAEWLEGYLCRVRRLRSNTAADLRSALEGEAPVGQEVIDQLVEEAQDARAAALDDVKAKLGEERYARLRSVGGLSLLASELDCPEEP